MREFMYGINSVWISGILLLSMALLIEVGHRFGIRAQPSANDAFKTHVSAISASLLGILALLLGFTFSLSLQRFESRSEAVVSEANSIGTAYLRSQLLPLSVRKNAQDMLRQYLDIRIKTSTIPYNRQSDLTVLLVQAGYTQNMLWNYARQAAEEDPNPVTSGLFIQSVNDLIDSFGLRNTELSRHVPESVLILLYATFLMAGAIIGYGSGLAGSRTSFVTYVLVCLIVVLVFIIIDLDRPHRGLIEVSQQSFFDLRASINEGVAQ